MADSNEPVSGNRPSSQQLGGNRASGSADDANAATSLEVSLQQAIQKQVSVSEVGKLIDTEPRLLEAEFLSEVTVMNGNKESWKTTPLGFAIMMQNEPVAEYLLQRGANVHALVTEHGWTMLHLAAQGHNQDDPEKASDQSDVVKSPATPENPKSFKAAKSRQERIFALVLNSGVRPDLRGSNGTTVFHLAALSGLLASMKLIFETCGRECINDKSRFGFSPLHMTCELGHTEIAEWLIDQGAALEEIVHTEIRGKRIIKNPLCCACWFGHVNTARMLLERGANPCPHQVTEGPVLIACFRGNVELFLHLRLGGASLWEVSATQDTCYHLIAQGESLDLVQLELLLAHLIPAIPWINKVNSQQETALTMACRLQKLVVVDLLISYGADVNARAGDGSTALIAACSRPDKAIVELLLRRGADVSATNATGQNAFHTACFYYQHKIVEFLIQQPSVQVTVKDHRNWTPLTYTALSNQKEANGSLAPNKEVAVDIALQILASREYCPPEPSLQRPFKEQDQYQSDAIQLFLLENFNLYCGISENLHTVMFWAVFNGALGLARKCISHNREVLNWQRHGFDLIHLASYSGACNMARLFLEKKTQHETEQEDLWSQLDFIIKEDNRGNSPLSIAIKNGHLQLEEFYWEYFRRLHDVKTDFVNDSKVATRNRVLETLARYEIPGHEVILRRCMKEWFFVWWLLSNGGYPEEAMRSAKSLVQGENRSRSPRFLIKEMLEQPPPVLDHVVNSNQQHQFSLSELDATPATQDQFGTIIDIQYDGEMIKFPLVEGSIKDIIYGRGPDYLMSSVNSEDWRQHGLHTLKVKLGETDGEPSDSSASSHSQAWPPEARNHLLRWIHLPTNELQIMRDLVSRLSSDAKRSIKDHMALMKHLDCSWIEMAAGADHHYMKPQCVQDTTKPRNVTHAYQSGKLVGSTWTAPCTALYMPYLTINPQFPRTSEPTDENASGKRYIDQDKAGYQRRKAGFEDKSSLIHDPMTLDQFYYSGMRNTDNRDRDQVLSKYLDKPEHHYESKPNDAENRTKILMVSQLWLWIIDDKTIITAATETANAECNGMEKIHHLRNAMLDRFLYGVAGRQTERATTVGAIVELILGVATGFFNKKTLRIKGGESTQVYRGPMDIFRESIREAAEEEANMFQEFLDSLERGAKSSKKHMSETCKKSLPESRSSDRIHVISREAKLLQQVRDIRDELHILKSLAEAQENVWLQTFAPVATGGTATSQFLTPTDVKKDLDDMISEAEEIDNKVNTLLELRQSELSRLQAYDAARQANSVFIFTVMTVIFLPLSFLVSLFALDVSIYPHDSGSVKYKAQWLFPIIFGVTAAVSIPAIVFANNIDSFSTRWRPPVNLEKGQENNTWKEKIKARRKEILECMGRRKCKDSSEV
ncbi:hypothetical protein E8E14_006812 [Neopestalotiopsis sp. 37M]|nr:hypothetical protein E8E14_006812 [Neopestalotiopsis sp. 37M]